MVNFLAYELLYQRRVFGVEEKDLKNSRAYPKYKQTLFSRRRVLLKKTVEERQTDFEITFFENLISDKPDFVDALIPLAAAYTRRGLYDKGLEIDRRLSEILRDDPIAYYNLACSYALTGKHEDALTNLRRSIELGYRDFRHLAEDPDLKSLSGHPEFQALVARQASRAPS